MNVRKVLIVAAALTCYAVAAAAPAAIKVISLELGLEASTDTITLPATNSGPLLVSCATCTPRSYPVTPQTTYFIGAKSVTLAELNTFVSRHSRRFLMIYVKPDASAITRIVVAAN
jgi:hypothetical protein